VVESGEPAIAPVHIDNLDDGQYEWFHVRGGTIVDGLGDAEGNSPEIRTIDGVDLLGDHYAGWVVLSTDGSRLAYTEHRDPAAFSHSFSPTVVLRLTDIHTEWRLGRAVVVQLAS
jgi:hypothetical protein